MPIYLQIILIELFQGYATCIVNTHLYYKQLIIFNNNSYKTDFRSLTFVILRGMEPIFCEAKEQF